MKNKDQWFLKGHWRPYKMQKLSFRPARNWITRSSSRKICI